MGGAGAAATATVGVVKDVLHAVACPHASQASHASFPEKYHDPASLCMGWQGVKQRRGAHPSGLPVQRRAGRGRLWLHLQEHLTG